MSGGKRRVIASIGCLGFLVFWIWAALAIGDRLPDDPMLKVLFFAVAGTAWGLPLFPLIAWANKGTDPGGGDRS